MIMKNILVNGKKMELPTTWAEVMNNRRDLVFITKLILKNPEQIEMLSVAAFYFMKVSKMRLARIASMFKYHPHHAHTQMLANSIYRAIEPLKFLLKPMPRIEKNYFPALFDTNKLYGSNNVLRDFTIWEYTLAEQSYIDYMTTKNTNDLDNFLAVWYRPAKLFMNLRQFIKHKYDDPRIAFQDDAIEGRRARIAKICPAKKYLIFLFFHNQREQLIKQYSFLFSGKNSGAQSRMNGWLNVILSMSQLGDEEKAANVKLSVILKRLEMNWEENQRMNEKLKVKN